MAIKDQYLAGFPSAPKAKAVPTKRIKQKIKKGKQLSEKKQPMFMDAPPKLKKGF